MKNTPLLSIKIKAELKRFEAYSSELKQLMLKSNGLLPMQEYQQIANSIDCSMKRIKRLNAENLAAHDIPFLKSTFVEL